MLRPHQLDKLVHNYGGSFFGYSIYDVMLMLQRMCTHQGLLIAELNYAGASICISMEVQTESIAVIPSTVIDVLVTEIFMSQQGFYSS